MKTSFRAGKTWLVKALKIDKLRIIFIYIKRFDIFGKYAIISIETRWDHPPLQIDSLVTGRRLNQHL